MRGRPGFALLAGGVLAAVSAPSAAGERPALDYRLSVAVEWGTPRGPEGFRSALEQQVLLELTEARCFREVHEGSPDAPQAEDLRLDLLIDGLDESTDSDVGLAEHHDPDLQVRDSVVARIEADFYLRVRTAEGGTVRERRLHQSAAWRPAVGEDPRRQAAQELIDGIARSTRKFACGGSPAEWSRQLERARGASER